METQTYWGCERCRRHGAVEHEEHAGVWEVYIKVVDAHHAASEGRCIDPDYIRVSKEPFQLVMVDIIDVPTAADTEDTP